MGVVKLKSGEKVGELRSFKQLLDYFPRMGVKFIGSKSRSNLLKLLKWTLQAELHALGVKTTSDEKIGELREKKELHNYLRRMGVKLTGNENLKKLRKSKKTLSLRGSGFQVG